MDVKENSSTRQPDSPSDLPGESKKASMPTSATTVTGTTLEVTSEDNCKHVWCDLYQGQGISKANPDVCLVTFFCKYCLEIVIRSYNVSRFKGPDDDD